MKPTQEQIEIAAAAIANARGGRRGMPPISNVLVMLKGVSPTLHAEVMEDAEAALEVVSLEMRQQRDELSDEMERCHRLLDTHWGLPTDSVALDTLEDRIKMLLTEVEQTQSR